MKTLSSFKGMKVVTEEGMFLGHLVDLRADSRIKQRESAATAEIGAVVYGVAGWLVRLGLRTADEQTIDWREVVQLKGDRLIVRNRKSRKSDRLRSRAGAKSRGVR